MNLPWLRHRTAARLDAEQQRRREALPAAPALDERPLASQRFVVVDLETTGLNMRRDVVLSIGAVVIEHGAIDLGQQFECTLNRPIQDMGVSVLIHGIAPSALARGIEPAEALLAFMEFVGDSPLLAFHAEFDRHMLRRALRHTLGYRLRHPFLDVAELAPMLCPDRKPAKGGLDDWAERFALQVDQRHHASADALATAQLALILFSHARRQALDSPAGLAQRLAVWRRRQRGLLL
ncbi:3'-5' exonuclease [Stutzerimonas azotifigens]|uniref:3'-5' exonuclease n=1 Tax=Stutzerimonas azotifigens TaxID=291995 RepID=UPI00041FAE47|nr:3'-5' exonuclease [Stutzerimonas azotifigens]